MRYASPLRYPGGKSAMADLLRDLRKINQLGNRQIAEPFAGGAGASLALLYLEEATGIHVNDADPAIHDFWWTLKHRPQPFLELLSKAKLNMSEWRRQRDIYRRGSSVSKLRRGFSAFYLNRCNRSGIILNGGPIGGTDQTGEWGLDARFNKPELRARCEKFVEYRDRISVSQDDGIAFIERIAADSTFFFVDPPYFNKGPTLYMNSLDDRYHKSLANLLRTKCDDSWVLTYDDCPEIRRMYRGWATIRPFKLRYAAAERRPGKEVLICPKWMQLPRQQASAALTW